MKVFPSTGSGRRISSTYLDVIEHRRAAHDENHPRMKSRTFGEYQTPIRVFVKNSWTVCLKITS